MSVHEGNYVPGNPALAGSPLAVVVSGCSGSGKSSLLGELAGRGHQIVPEAGRQIVREEILVGADDLLWNDPYRFADLIISRSCFQFNMAKPLKKPVFFDRSIVDSVAYLEFKGLEVPERYRRAVGLYRYAPEVFITPPWEEIYVSDRERPKPFEEALGEYEALIETYHRLDYATVIVPRGSVGERADFVEAHLNKTVMPDA